MEQFPRIAEAVAVDTETFDPDLMTRGPGWAFNEGGFVCGISVATSYFSGYLPVRHADGNMEITQVVRWLKSFMENPQIPKIFANASYDIGWLRRMGVETKGEIHDVQIQAPLLDEHKYSYSLDNLAKEYINSSKDESSMYDWAERNKTLLGIKKGCDAKKAMHKIPAHIVEPYATQDAVVTRDLYLDLKKKIVTKDLTDIYNLERSLVPMLVDMRWNGVRVDMAEADRQDGYFRGEEKKALAELKRIAGHEVLPWTTSTISPMFDKLGIPYKLTAKTKKPSITKDFLDTVDHPAADLLRRTRKMQNAYGNFTGGLDRFVVDGRIHCELHQLKSVDDQGGGGGTISGRFSCSKPNLQQQPSPGKDPEIGSRIRAVFLPEEGEQWGAPDYSQQEPRLTVHWAAGLGIPSAIAAVQTYAENPDTDYHTFVAELTGLSRKPAKIINLGLAYGMGGPKLCRSLGLPVITKQVRDWKKPKIKVKYMEDGFEKEKEEWQMMEREYAGEEGQEILERYHKFVPFVKKLEAVYSRKASRQGFVRTILGRHCHFKKGDDGKYWGTYRAMNRLIQGSAADQMKKAMLEMYNAGITPLITVHDEVGISFSDPKTLDICKEIMETCVPLRVPSKVDIGIGANFGKASEE